MSDVLEISRPSVSDAEWQLRVDLAAAFRIAAHFNWHESVGNHFSVAVSDDGSQFLMNPKWMHFSAVRASDLLLLDANDPEAMQGPDAPDPTAWCIHGAIHRLVPRARVLLHCHPKYSTALAMLKDPSMPPVDQNTARFFGKMGIDFGFDGLADSTAEGERIAGTVGNNTVLMMGNHGITIVSQTVAEAVEELYYFERAAETLMYAYASGRELNVMPDDVAAKTAAQFEEYAGIAFAHFDYLKSMLDGENPGFRE